MDLRIDNDPMPFKSDDEIIIGPWIDNSYVVGQSKMHCF